MKDRAPHCVACGRGHWVEDCPGRGVPVSLAEQGPNELCGYYLSASHFGTEIHGPRTCRLQRGHEGQHKMTEIFPAYDHARIEATRSADEVDRLTALLAEANRRLLYWEGAGVNYDETETLEAWKRRAEDAERVVQELREQLVDGG